MKTLEYKVSFTTPAFLGNAEQQAQWRTPPFKALIRQWWRVVHAPKVGYEVAQLRRHEAALFGSAADEGGATSGKSLVRLRLDAWRDGAMREWQTCGAVQHPEVGQGGQSVGADLYLGYGPLVYEKGRTVLGTVRDTGVKRTAIEPAKAFAILRLGYPVECEDELTQTLQLVSCFGTFGSRSRNGWGSLHIEGGGITTLSRQLLNGYLRPLIKCLQVDWPHAIGSDNKGPLVWITAPKNDWREVMKELAGIKIAFRTQPQLLSLEGKHDGDLSGRHVLAYPVTNHAVLGPINKKENEAGWVDVDTRTGKPKTDKRGKFIQSARLANQVRLKVAKHANGQFVGIIVHVPCKLPGVLVNKFEPKNAAFIRDNELRVWQQVHAVLDNSTNRLSRL